MTKTDNVILCPACGKEFPWNPRFMGRQARCPCGQMMEYPLNPSTHVETAPEVTPPSEDGLYDLAPETPRAETAFNRPVDKSSGNPAGSLATAPPLSYRSASLRGTTTASAADLDTEKLTKQTLPLWLLTGGLIVEGAIPFFRKWPVENPYAALIHLLLGVGVGTVVMTAGVLIAAKVRQIEIGSLGSAALRLAALILGTAAIGDILTPFAYVIPFGGLALLIIHFALYFALLGVFFGLDHSDTWYCVCVIFLLNLGIYFAIRFAVR